MLTEADAMKLLITTVILHKLTQSTDSEASIRYNAGKALSVADYMIKEVISNNKE